MEHATCEWLERKILDRVKRARRNCLDELILTLHGAMVADEIGAVEGRVAGRARVLLGDSFPIVVTTDFHGNLGPALVEAADAATGYDTSPHDDAYERALEACALVARPAWSELRGARAIATPPILTTPQGCFDAHPPMRALIDRALELERWAGVVYLTVASGFPLSDVPEAAGRSCSTAAGSNWS